ncbi:MAG: IS630 family transposase [Planctomycetes bacterium]|nr:IS630 family transposase [Planctomycetota bacterium]
MKRRLWKAMQKTKDAEYRTRLLIVLKYDEGKGAKVVAGMVGVVPSTAIRVLHRFQRGGEDSLVDQRRENGVPKVDDDARQALAEIVAKSPQDFGWERPTWTRELLALVLAEEAGVEVSERTVGRMLDTLGARYGSPKPIVFCPWSDREKKAAYGRIRRLLAGLPGDEVAYFEDEVDIHLNPKIGRDWMLPRTQKLVLTPGNNVKRYVAGALRADGSDLVWVSSDRKRSLLFIDLLKALRERHPHAVRIHLVLDNFSIHKSKITGRYLDDVGGVFHLHFLPPYSPDENKIERLWRDLHANVTRNHRCTNIDSLMDNVDRFLTREAARRRSRARHTTRTNLPRSRGRRVA